MLEIMRTRLMEEIRCYPMLVNHYHLLPVN
jgi:hypothetical protein